MLFFPGLQPESKWAWVHPQRRKAPGFPEIRYSAAAAFSGGQLIVTHGYQYNKDANQAMWMDDTWSLDPASRRCVLPCRVCPPTMPLGTD